MDFWKAQSQDLWWKCRTRSPAHEHDRRASDIVDVEGSPGEYADYAKLLQEKDPTCLEENAVAYPRLLLENWCGRFVTGVTTLQVTAGPFSWNPSVDCRVARFFFQPRTCDGRMVPIRQCTRPKIAGETLAGVDSAWSQGFVLQVDQNVHHSLLAGSSMRCNENGLV